MGGYYKYSSDKVIAETRQLKEETQQKLVKATEALKAENEDYEFRSSALQKGAYHVNEGYYESKRTELKRSTHPPLAYVLFIAALVLALPWISFGRETAPSDGVKVLFLWLFGGYLVGAGVRISLNKKKIGAGLFIWGPVGAAFAVMGPGLLYSKSAALMACGYISLPIICVLCGVGLILSKKNAIRGPLAELEKQKTDAKNESRRNFEEFLTLQDSHNKKAKEYKSTISTLQELQNGEIKKAVDEAIARATILRVVDIKETTEELREYNAQVNTLHDELTQMVRSDKDKNLPEEADWAAIDALYDRVYRGYADTRKEALLQVHADKQHAQLIASMAANYKQLQELRTQTSRQLESITDQEAQLALIAQDQLRILVGSLGVQTKQLDELQNQTSQSDLILAVQKEANKLAAEQIKQLNRIYWAIPRYIP